MRNAAFQIMKEDLRLHGSEIFDNKTYNNPLKETFGILGEILVERSQEEMERETARKREVRNAKAAQRSGRYSNYNID